MGMAATNRTGPSSLAIQIYVANVPLLWFYHQPQRVELRYGNSNSKAGQLWRANWCGNENHWKDQSALD